MIDPGAMGTLIIGLESIRSEQDRAAHPPRSRRTAASRRGSYRVAVARALREIADRLERPVLNAPAGRA